MSTWPVPYEIERGGAELCTQCRRYAPSCH